MAEDNEKQSGTPDDQQGRKPDVAASGEGDNGAQKAHGGQIPRHEQQNPAHQENPSEGSANPSNEQLSNEVSEEDKAAIAEAERIYRKVSSGEEPTREEMEFMETFEEEHSGAHRIMSEKAFTKHKDTGRPEAEQVLTKAQDTFEKAMADAKANPPRTAEDIAKMEKIAHDMKHDFDHHIEHEIEHYKDEKHKGLKVSADILLVLVMIWLWAQKSVAGAMEGAGGSSRH